jgi:pyridoxamine 5'-phosphate oxidase
MVYLKELDSSGNYVIYSNFGSSGKARDLFGSEATEATGATDATIHPANNSPPNDGGNVQANPWASLVFWWKPLERQVRVEGRATRLTDEESQVYYDTRARGSRIGAWASQQTRVLDPVEGVQGDDGRARLETWVREIEERFEGQEQIPVPPFWGGLRIVPEMVEFWQGRESRLHDRFRYTRLHEGKDEWKIERLSP